MRKTLTTLAIALTAGIAAFAQQDPQFSMNMFNRLATNPGYAGTNKALCGTLIGRHQWMGFTDSQSGQNVAPKTYLVSVDANVWQRHGIGVTVFSDQLGFEKTFSAKLAYSFHIALGAGTLGIGPEVGMVQKSIGGPWRATLDYTQDPSIPANASDITYDVGFGAYYVQPGKLYFGLSSTHLTESDLSQQDPNRLPKNLDYQYTIARHYYVTAGYTFNATSDFDIEPSVFVKSDASSTQLDLNVRGIYNKFFWGGVSYRLNDAIVAMVGLERAGLISPNGTVKFGYSYDVTTSAMGKTGSVRHSSGSHELMLGYCHNIVKPPKRTIHENVRFP